MTVHLSKLAMVMHILNKYVNTQNVVMTLMRMPLQHVSHVMHMGLTLMAVLH